VILPKPDENLEPDHGRSHAEDNWQLESSSKKIPSDKKIAEGLIGGSIEKSTLKYEPSHYEPPHTY